MTTFNTGNPLGSTDARDLYDNAENFDRAVNQMTPRWTDRFGVSRRSWAGMAAYVDLGDYVADLLITGYNEIFRHEGEFYRAGVATALPYTTTGSWSEDGPYFVPIGDAALRQDIAETADMTIGYYRNAVNCNQFGGLEAALADIDTLGKIIVVTDAQTISENTTVTGRVISPEYGAIITIASSKTLTINSNFTTGAYQVFAGTGSVAGLKEARPEWFGNNTTDYSDAINKADASLSDGGILQFSAKTYPCAGITISSKHHWRGAGKNATILHLKTGANADLLKSSTFDTLTGGNTLGGDYSFSISDLTIDGNKANNTAGSGVKIYGYDFKIINVGIRNFKQNGLVTEWTTNPNSPTVDLDFVESTLSNVTVHTNDGDGILWGGPHDSIWNNVIAYRNAGTYNARVYQGGGPLYMNLCHFWGSDVDYALYAEKRVMATNCVAEGASVGQVYIAGSNSSWYGGEVFGASGIPSKGFILAGTLSGIEIITQIRDCLTASVDFGSGPSSSKFIISNYQASGTPRTGTIPTDGTVIFNSTGVSGYNINRFNSVPQAIDSEGTLRNVLLAYGRSAITTAAGAQTVSVAAKTFLQLTSAAPANITNFTNAYDGQEITLLFADGNTTITNGATIALAGGISFTGTVVDTLKLIYSVASTKWYEVSRSIN